MLTFNKVFYFAQYYLFLKLETKKTDTQWSEMQCKGNQLLYQFRDYINT